MNFILKTKRKYAALMLAMLCAMPNANAQSLPTHKAYVYTELQISAPFSSVPWQGINNNIKAQSGFINKTWLSGVGNNSAGGFYVFDTIEKAQKFVTEYFPSEAKNFNVAHTTRIFDAEATQEASKDMNSVYYGGALSQEPKAFVYTELQIQKLPFNDTVDWKSRNPIIKTQKGLLSKTWLSGVNTGTIGGFYAFDSIENAKNFAINDFPKVAQELKSAFYTRVFDASATKEASIDMNSPFYP